MSGSELLGRQTAHICVDMQQMFARFGQQLTTCTAQDVLNEWREAA